jgi:peptidyl-dipeptidase Dcp
MADNPFAQPSTLAFELPPFDRIHDSDYLPAFEAGMREELREVAAIADDPRPATFENTIVALERAGRLLARVESTFSRLNACNTDAQMQQIDTETAPKLTAHRDAIHLNPRVWARVDSLYRARATLHLDAE